MSKHTPLSEAFEIYRQDFIVYNNQSKKTEEMHGLALKSLISFLGDIDIESLTFQHIRDWKDHLLKVPDDKGKTKGINTVRGYILKLRVVIAYLRKRGYQLIDEKIIGIPKRKSTVVEFITEHEVKQLIDASFAPKNGYSTLNRHRNRAVISILYASGIRVSELCSLNRTTIQPDSTFTVVGKGDKPRLCFLDERTQLYLGEYLSIRDDNNPALFLSDLTKERMSVATAQEIFKRARVKARFTKLVHPHTMRHSFATNLLRNGTNLLYVSKFLGHASVQTTEMYTHVVDEDLRRVYQEKHTTENVLA